jgi:predicted nucleic acid-binding protein
MGYLLDTSILVRLANVTDLKHLQAVHAVLELHRRGEVLQITPQVLVEFRSVVTRPTAVNGLGLSSKEAEALAVTFKSRFPLLSETPDVYPAWNALVSALEVMGKQVHDARLAAVCHVHAVTHILTFNAGHFRRLAGFGPGLIVIDPADV